MPNPLTNRPVFFTSAVRTAASARVGWLLAGFPLAILFAAALVPTVLSTAWAQQSPKPFTQEQVKAMVRDGLANNKAAKAVATQGIDFTPSDDLLRELQAAGASETFLAALRNAPHPAAARPVETANPSTRPPVDQYQLLSLLAAGLPDQRVIELVQQRGVTQLLRGQITDSQSPYPGWFQGLGASDDLISTLRSASTFPDPDAAVLQSHKRTSEQELHERLQQNPENRAARLALLMISNENRQLVGAKVQSAKLIYQPAPVYPPLAKMARIQGVVRLYAIIGKDGTVQQLEVMTGHPLLIKAAMDAVKNWRYQPTLLNGAPVEVATQIDVNFTLAL